MQSPSLNPRDFWHVYFTCLDCGQDMVRFARRDPDEIVRCFHCETSHVHAVSDWLLTLALGQGTDNVII